MVLISVKLKPSDINDRLEIRYFDEGNVYLVNGIVVEEKQFIECAKKDPVPGTLQFIKTNINNDDEIYI
jgi:hypothetical protein